MKCDRVNKEWGLEAEEAVHYSAEMPLSKFNRPCVGKSGMKWNKSHCIFLIQTFRPHITNLT